MKKIRLMRPLRARLTQLLMAGLLVMSFPVQALDAINTTFFGNLAIKGYDPVAYFVENRAVKGKAKFEHEWMEANWRFSSKDNLEAFKRNPDKYAPAYGGYCAYAVSQNDIAGIEPEQFTIYKGRLYLNYNQSINQKWLSNRDSYITDADRYWPELLKK